MGCGGAAAASLHFPACPSEAAAPRTGDSDQVTNRRLGSSHEWATRIKSRMGDSDRATRGRHPGPAVRLVDARQPGPPHLPRGTGGRGARQPDASTAALREGERRLTGGGGGGGRGTLQIMTPLKCGGGTCTTHTQRHSHNNRSYASRSRLAPHPTALSRCLGQHSTKCVPRPLPWSAPPVHRHAHRHAHAHRRTHGHRR